MANHPALSPATRLGGRSPSGDKHRIPEWVVSKRGLAFLCFPVEDPKEKRAELLRHACDVAADIEAGKYPGFRLITLAVSKTIITIVLTNHPQGWPTDDKLFALLARQGVGINEEMIVDVTGVLELKDETFNLDAIPYGQWYLPDGCILALPRKVFREFCIKAGVDPSLGQVQGTIWAGDSAENGIAGKGMIIESPYDHAVSNVIPVGETRQLDLRDVWIEQRQVGRTGKARPSFFGALSLLAPIDSRYGELIQFLVDSVNARASKVVDIFKFVPANLEDEEVEDMHTETTGSGIAEFCMASHAPVPESMLNKVREKSERLLLSRIGDGLRFGKYASGLAFGTPYLPRGVVFKSGAKFKSTFCVRHPFMGIGSVLPVVLIGKEEHVDDALRIVGFSGNPNHVKHYVRTWEKNKLVHINNLDLLALLGDSDGDALHVFGNWTGEYRPVVNTDFVVEQTKLRQEKGLGLHEMEPNERINRMVYRATKGQIGLFDGPAMNASYAALMLLNKGSITKSEYVKVLNTSMLTKHLFGVVGVKHRIKDQNTGEYLSPEYGLNMLEDMADSWMKRAGLPIRWTDTAGIKHRADTPRLRSIKLLKRLGKDKGILKFEDTWRLRLDVTTGFGAFYKQLIDRVHHVEVSVVPDSEYIRAMYQFVLENIDEYELIPDPDKDEGHRTIRTRVDALLHAYDMVVYGMRTGAKTSVELGWNDLMAKISDPRISFWASLVRASTSGKIPYGLLVCPMQIAGCAHRFARELRSRIRNVREEYLYFPSEK